jgi:hypothetical protein
MVSFSEVHKSVCKSSAHFLTVVKAQLRLCFVGKLLTRFAGNRPSKIVVWRSNQVDYAFLRYASAVGDDNLC